MKRRLISAVLACLVAGGALAQAMGSRVTWDARSLMFDGRRAMPVMGEVHYSRIPAEEWRKEVRKMREGGVTIVATYVFWNHVEEIEGQFDWSGQRDLRRFIEVCREEGLPVVLRVGPFCHGEVRCGGIPDWVFAKTVEAGGATRRLRVRSEDAEFLECVRRLYREIFRQVEGLQWKDGGPLVACQFDNEYRGRGSYLMALKRMAQEIGFDLPFYTRTGWPELSTPVPFGEMIPLYGDYADGFWDRGLDDRTGDYWKGFRFKAFRSSTAIASEQLGRQRETLAEGDGQYPFFTCELGGGMMTSYHRRVYVYPEDAYSLAIAKLGSGSNLLGYYMYHGGTNPDGKLTHLNEHQRTPATNYNDLPVKTYDFQAPLGEFGQRNPHYYTLRKLHLFMRDCGELLAPMDPVFPDGQPAGKDDDSALRWSYRTDGRQAFVFFNNYDRLHPLSEKRGVRFSVCGVEFPREGLDIPDGAMGVFPVNLRVGGATLTYATAQVVAVRDGRVYLAEVAGVRPELCVDGTVCPSLRARGARKAVLKKNGVAFYLLSGEEAGRLFLDKPEKAVWAAVPFRKEREAGKLREITIGVQNVAEEPVDADFADAAVYRIDVPNREGLLDIQYQGDCARLYANGRLIGDNFYNGRSFQYALWRLPKDVETLELRILPMQQGMPVYFPREADTTPGEKVVKVSATTSRRN